MRILLVEPFFTGSHKAWAEGLQKHSSHKVTLLTMSGHHWKWRMHGAAITLARKFLEMQEKFDLILVSDMLDLTTFQSLTRKKSSNTPFALYFHENQLSYPSSVRDSDQKASRDNHYAFINFISALAADHCFFNSEFHRKDFLEKLGPFLNAFPDHNEQNARLQIEKKSSVLPLGMDLSAFDTHRQEKEIGNGAVILWNHRWEYDKDPETFFRALFKLAERKIPFRLVVLGEQFKETPSIFEEARVKLADHILHWGQADDFAVYAKWLWKAHLLPVTSKQDFFGGSVVEGIYCHCIPLLPKRLAFPEHIPENYHSGCLYEEGEDLSLRIEKIIGELNLNSSEELSSCVSRYDWSTLIKNYDNMLEKVKGHPEG